ncbi:MAG: DUF1343 domain-containing protein [Bacteroidales bacterium]|nr:DUF1343 domain-containing protein [Bacteroidales bacterium]
MFSFRTTTIFDQQDSLLSKGRLAVLNTPSAWYPEADCYLYELIAKKWHLDFIFNESELTPELLKLKNPDALIIEKQDTGDIFNPFINQLEILFRWMHDTGNNTAIYILDRPNPSGRQVEGVHNSGIPQKHGLTLAEIANMFYTDIGATFPLHIISAEATMAGRLLMPWTIPADEEFASLFSANFHCGQYLWNGTNISHGEGTERPYEFFGAPFINPSLQTDSVYNKGVFLRHAGFIPSSGPYAGLKCFGFQLIANPAEQYNSYLHAIRLIRWIKDSTPEFQFNSKMEALIGDDMVMRYLNGAQEWDITKEYIKTEEQKWVRKAKKYLLYDMQPFRVK